MSNEFGTSTPNPKFGGSDALSENWGWFLALGIAMTAVGVMAVILPGLAGLGLTLMLGWLLLVGGLVQGIHAFFARAWKGFFVQALTAILYLIVGLILLANPLEGMLTLTYLLAAFLLIEGVFKIAMAFQIRPATNWGWVFLSGVMALVLSAVVWVNLPGDFVWVLGLLVGVNIIFSGCSTMMIALAAGGYPAVTGQHGMSPKSHA
jgi:uncharacterized membrane protein HdeD (DUF308 family)